MQFVRDTYIRALVEVANCNPLLVPVLEDGIDAEDLVKRVDGFLLTGARSHVNPDCYGHQRTFEDSFLDNARDATSIPILKAAIASDKPIMAICRGFQELNIAMGGTLNQSLHTTPGRMDHRASPELTTMEKFERRAHKVMVHKGGWFEKMGLPAEFTVNSIHEQGIDKLGNGLQIEATSEDGLIEAISLPGKTFVVGTQWHPEGDWPINPSSRRILASFGEVFRQ